MPNRIATNDLGSFLKDRRGRLDPAAFGLPEGRRRTPGLRREEVAQRAVVSPTWYTWLEQGRGGAPSAQVLDRIADALMLTEAERDHLFMLGLGRPPEPRVRSGGGVTPRLQRVLDGFEQCPAMLRNVFWDVLAWNRAASRVLFDYGTVEPARRNVLRVMFGAGGMRAHMPDWDKDARFVVASFRADLVRAGAMAEAAPLIDDLMRGSADFAAMWRENEVRDTYGEAAKRVMHPVAGEIALETSSFVVSGRPDLGLAVYVPATQADAEKVRRLIEG